MKNYLVNEPLKFYSFSAGYDATMENLVNIVNSINSNPALSDEDKFKAIAMIKMGYMIHHPDEIDDMEKFIEIVNYINQKNGGKFPLVKVPKKEEKEKSPESTPTSTNDSKDLQDNESPSTSCPQPIEKEPESSNSLKKGEDPKKSKKSKNSKKKIRGRKKGQGNIKRDAINVNLNLLINISQAVQAGKCCPGCGGKIVNYGSLSKIIVSASPLLEHRSYDLETTRCSACRTLYRAKLPDELGKVDLKSGWTSSARALAIISRFELGIPAHRLERVQEKFGCPVSDSQLIRECKTVFEELKPLWQKMQEFVVDEADYQIIDDGAAHIIKEKKRLQEESLLKRSGIFVSIIYGYTNERGLFIFKSGPYHMGEKMLADDYASLRSKKVIRLMDGSSCGTINSPSELQKEWGINLEPKGFAPIDSKQKNRKEPIYRSFSVTVANCWQHVRKHLEDSADAPVKSRDDLLDSISNIYITQKEWQKSNLEESNILYAKLIQQVDTFFENVEFLYKSKVAEPNSKWGKVLKYILKRKQGLLVFLEHKHLPLDTNRVERAVKFHHRYNHNSLHFYNQNGAEVGDFFMSIVHSAKNYNINSIEYLTNIIEYSNEVTKNPEAWLPWSYKNTLQIAREKRAEERTIAMANNAPDYDIPHRLKSDREPILDNIKNNKESSFKNYQKVEGYTL